RVIEGPKMIEVTNEKVVVSKEKIKEMQCSNSYSSEELC
nr:hypothetical protein [Tanacetum cinerariifolium]